MFFSSGRIELTDEMRTATQGLLLCVAALVCIGLVMIFSVCAAQSAATGAPLTGALVRRLVWVAVGAAGLCVAAKLNLAWLEEQRALIVGLAGLMLLVVLIPAVGTARYGARRWIRLGSIGVQPSEFAKLCLLVFIAGYAKEHRSRLHTWKEGLLLPGVVIGAVCGLIFLEPDFGTAMLIGLVSLSVLMIAGSRVWQVGLAASSALPALGVMILSSPPRWRRIVAFLNPEQHSSGAAYQMIQAVTAAGSGGALGAGAGAGGQKYFFLPQSATDFIFAIIGEEFGLLGTAAVLALFAGVVWFGMRIAMRTRDPFASLVACGVTLYIGIQATIHVAVATGSAPTKGITLPFISLGGSSLVASLIGIGLLLAAARRASAEAAAIEAGYTAPSLVRRSTAAVRPPIEGRGNGLR